MQKLKTAIYASLLVAVAATWFICGQLYESGMREAYTDPVIEKVEVPVETLVPVEIPVERKYLDKLILGITPDGELAEVGDSPEESFVYIVELHYNPSHGYSDIKVLIPAGDDSYMVVTLGVPSDDYRVMVRKVGGEVTPPKEGEDDF